jgi:hypothetical protein
MIDTNKSDRKEVIDIVAWVINCPYNEARGILDAQSVPRFGIDILHLARSGDYSSVLQLITSVTGQQRRT